MRRGGKILIVLGMILGLITFIGALLVLSTGGGRAQVPMTKVVVAHQNVPQRAPIPAAALTLVDWPTESLPPGYFTDPAQVADKLATSQIVAGQVIVQEMVVEKKLEETRKGLGSTASFIVPKGKVAVAFPINQVTGVGAALKEGDTVDLLVSYELPATGASAGQASSSIKRQITQLALQDVEVLRVGLWNEPATGETTIKEVQNITFLVNRQDALVLKFLRETTTEVQLALRAAGDHDVATTEPVIHEYIDQRFNLGGVLGRPR